MFFQITFRDIWTSQPEVYQNATLVQISSASQLLSGGMNLFGRASNLADKFAGRAQQAQQGSATGILGQSQQVINALMTTSNTINSTAQVMKAAKARLVSLVAQARALGIRVDLNTGRATPMAWRWSPDRWAAGWALAARFNTQIQLVVAQVNTHDAMVKMALAATAMDAVSFVMDATGMSKTAEPPAASGPGAGLPITTVAGQPMPAGAAPQALGPDGAGSGFGLSAAGDLTAGTDRAGIGAGAGPGRAAALAGAAGTAGAAASLSGAGAGASGGPLLVGRAGAAGGVTGMGAGALGVAGRGDERESSGWRRTTEDEDVFAPADIPDTNDGVLA